MSKEKTTDNSAKRTHIKCSVPSGDSRSAAGGKLHKIAGGEHPALTTNQGVAISDNQNSLKANPCGIPSVLFDAVAVILSAGGAQTLSKESAAIDFVRDAFGHLKAIAADKGGRALLKTAKVGQDADVVDANNKDAFIAAAKTRQWDREKSVRTLA